MSHNCQTAFARAICLILGLIQTAVATQAMAQFGPVLTSTGAINRSMGGTSTAAPLSVGGALLWNPATLSAMRCSEIEIGAELLFPHATVASIIPANSLGAGVPPIDLAGSTNGQDSVFALPTLALAYRPNDSSFTFGLGAFAVAGFGLNYAGSTSNPILTPPPPTGLGFGPIFSQYQVLQIAPALVVDMTERWSVSFSPLLDIGSAQLDPAVIASPDDANGDGFATYPSGTHSRQSWGAGFSLGTYYRANDWGFGASYKSRQWFQPYEFNTANELGVGQTVNFKLDLPSIVSAGIAYHGFERWLMAADLRYLDFNGTDGFGTSGFSPTGALRGLGLESIFAVALGSQYQLSDSISLRTGYSWSENPVTDAQASANVASPLVIQNIFSTGGSYQVTRALALSSAYSHAFENSVSGPIVLPTGAIASTLITSSASIDMAIFGATVRF